MTLAKAYPVSRSQNKSLSTGCPVSIRKRPLLHNQLMPVPEQAELCCNSANLFAHDYAFWRYLRFTVISFAKNSLQYRGRMPSVPLGLRWLAVNGFVGLRTRGRLAVAACEAGGGRAHWALRPASRQALLRQRSYLSRCQRIRMWTSRQRTCQGARRGHDAQMAGRSSAGAVPSLVRFRACFRGTGSALSLHCWQAPTLLLPVC